MQILVILHKNVLESQNDFSIPPHFVQSNLSRPYLLTSKCTYSVSVLTIAAAAVVVLLGVMPVRSCMPQ